MITVTLEEYKKYNDKGTANQIDLDNASAVIYDYINFAEPTDSNIIDTVKKSIMMFADYELDNGIATGVAKNEIRSVGIGNFSYSTGGSKISDINKAKMPPYIRAILAPTGLLYRGLC